MERRRILVVAAALVACLGVALVLLYVRGADHRAQQQYDTTNVLTAKAQINAGETIEAAAASGKLVMTPVTNNAVLPGAVSATDSLKGEVATTTIYPGEQLIAAKFGTTAAPTSALTIPKGLTAVSVELSDAGRVAGFVEPGSYVSVYLSGADPDGKAFDSLLVARVQVLGVGSTTMVSTTTTSNDGQTTQQVPSTLLTLAVTQKQAQKVLFGQQNGTLSFGLLTDDSVVAPGPMTTYANVLG